MARNDNSQQDEALRILRVDASGRETGSVSRALADRVVARLSTGGPGAEIVRRDLSRTPPGFVDASWIDATFTPPGQRTESQRQALATSDELVTEVQRADVVVIATPVYNFGVPASLKAWVDMVARAGETFRYSDDGPVGLLHNKRAILVVASGGTALDGDTDFATPWLRHVLGFLGIHEVETVAADQLMLDPGAETRAREAVDRLELPVSRIASAA
jgi:FMN-dependent NADH-azoreductase